MQKPPEGKLFINLYENLCLKYLLINIRNTVSDGATRTLVLNIEGHIRINCCKEFEPDVFEYFLCTALLETQDFTRDVLPH